jgi:hypothetical protein
MLPTERRDGSCGHWGRRKSERPRGISSAAFRFQRSVVRLGVITPRLILLLLICDSYIISIRIRQFCISQHVGRVASTVWL